MTSNIKNYINDLSISIDLKQFIITLLESTSLKERQLGMYIIIEIRHKLLDIDHFENTIEYINSNGLNLSFETFTQFRPIRYNNKCEIKNGTFSRIVSKETFVQYIGDFLFESPYIDNSKITLFGWSTRNRVVWVTPTDEINNLIASCIDPFDKANMVCDYVGFPRQFTGEEYIKINYSPNFNECVYQPNSSNILWHYNHIIFLPIKITDFYGRTYNENGVVFAKEQVHETSFFIDDLFNAEKVGKIDAKFPINDNILHEAEKRFNS